MSKEAETIEEARRLYVRHRGTENEALARAYLEAVVEKARQAQKSRDGLSGSS